MNKFDSIRPYQDQEVNSTLRKLAFDKDIVNTIIDTKSYPLINKLPFSRMLISLMLWIRVRKIETIREYQDIFEGIVNNIVGNTMSARKLFPEVKLLNFQESIKSSFEKTWHLTNESVFVFFSMMGCPFNSSPIDAD